MAEPNEPPPRSDEHELVRRAGRGDRAALAELALRYELLLLGLARSLLRGREDLACDAVQDCWLRVIRSGRHFQGNSSVKTWLYRIVINRCSDLRARLLAESNGHAAVVSEPAAEPPPPARNLQTVMESLSGEQRLLLILCYHAGMTHVHAADILGIPVGTLKSRLHAALEHLRSRLALEDAQ